jgi:putative protease
MRIFVAAASAGSAVSAIQNGADGIILSSSIPTETLGGFFPYARARGVLTAMDYSRECGDAQLEQRAEALSRLYPLGIDAVFTGDAGTLRMAAKVAPGCDLIWSEGCMTAEDIEYAADNGCTSAALSPFLLPSAIKQLASSSKLPLLFWFLSPLCPGGGRSGCLMDKEYDAHKCGQSCRKTLLAHIGDNVTPLLKTRDLSLLKHSKKLGGLTALVVPPAMTPEAAGLFTRFARTAADEHYVNERELNEAFAALGRETPTDAPYTGKGDIYASGEAETAKNERYWEAERKNAAEQGERPCVPVRFFALMTEGEPSRLAVDDYRGHTVYVEGAPAERGGARNAEEELNGIWRGVSGMYICRDARTKISPGLCLPLPRAEALLNAAMAKLEETKQTLPERRPGSFKQGAKLLPRADKPRITVRVSKLSQVTAELLSLPPERLYIPLEEASGDPSKAEWLVRSKTVPVAVLPRIQTEEDRAEVSARLKILHDAGFREALTWTPGQAVLVKKLGFAPRADWGAASTQTLRAVRMMGVLSCTLAAWMPLSGVSRLSHICDTELIVYGRLPLLIARQCMIKRKDGLCVCENKCELSDGQGGLLPLVREGSHSTLVYQAQKLWMLPYRQQWRHIGLWAVRLDFTTENARECADITLAFAGRGDYEPHSFTTGFYLPEDKKRFRGRK